ncbi:SLATT domain-containing protein [Streptomyces celluloflavus]|uniref:SLATT domain-containing protein n=1 Tax=Streptomyces celluloflavus TaxID=58344 RepID=UPI00369C073C
MTVESGVHTVAEGGVPDCVEILERWSRGLQMLHVAHNIASERFDHWNRVSGITTAMLSAVVGTTLFASLSASGLTGVRVVAGVASLLTAALSAGQLVWNYPELASRHRAAAVRYAALRRQVELRLANRDQLTGTDVEATSSAWEEVEQSAPQLPIGVRRHARREIANVPPRP